MVEWNPGKNEWKENRNLILSLHPPHHQEINHHQHQLKGRRRQLVLTIYLIKNIHQIKSHPVSLHPQTTPLFQITKSKSKTTNGPSNASNVTSSRVTWKTSTFTWTTIGQKISVARFVVYWSIARDSTSNNIWKSTRERNHLCAIFATVPSGKKHIWWSMWRHIEPCRVMILNSS